MINIEPFADNRGQFGRRMFRYFSRLFEKHALPVYPIYYYPSTRPWRLNPRCLQSIFPILMSWNSTTGVVQLNQMNWRDSLNQANPLASALMAKMRIAPADRPRLLGHLTGFQELTYIADFPCDRCGYHHRGTHEQCAPGSRALATLKVAVGRRRTDLLTLQLVWIHG